MLALSVCPRHGPVRSAVSSRRNRRGAIAVLAALMIVVMLAMVAFSVDIGGIMVARGELQRTADAAALAAAWDLIDEDALTGDMTQARAIANARVAALAFARRNHVLNASPGLNVNIDNFPEGDVVVGQIDDLSNPDTAMHFDAQNAFNAVRVRIQRSPEQNGNVPFFFARALGFSGTTVEAESTAAILKNIRGFEPPEDGSNLMVLPITVSESIWDDFLGRSREEETGEDNWTWNFQLQQVSRGTDGVNEINIYPQNQGAAGNFGTLKIGRQNNGTGPLARQIRRGITGSEIGLHGGELALDTHGELLLSGDPGISAGIKDDLAAIVGETRIIPVFRSVSGSGSNATFQIVKFAGVRIMEADLTGGGKRVIVQPANIVTKGAIPANSGSSSKSDFIYSAVRLIK